MRQWLLCLRTEPHSLLRPWSDVQSPRENAGVYLTCWALAVRRGKVFRLPPPSGCRLHPEVNRHVLGAPTLPSSPPGRVASAEAFPAQVLENWILESDFLFAVELPEVKEIRLIGFTAVLLLVDLGDGMCRIPCACLIPRLAGINRCVRTILQQHDLVGTRTFARGPGVTDGDSRRRRAYGCD